MAYCIANHGDVWPFCPFKGSGILRCLKMNFKHRTEEIDRLAKLHDRTSFAIPLDRKKEKD